MPASNSILNLPDEADVVIIGGGSLGCNILYQLSTLGINSILLERDKITSGTTWHSNGLFWRLRPNDVEIELLSAIDTVLPKVEKESDLSTGYETNGGLFIARTEERLKEYKRLHTIGKYFGIESHFISPLEAAAMHPLLDPTSFSAALYSPKDGRLDPTMMCTALVKAALKYQGKIAESCPVIDIVVDSSMGTKKIRGVKTRHGFIKTNCVVNSAGVWSTHVAKMVNLDIPLLAFKHAYAITESIPEAKNTPNVRDHDASICYKTLGDSIYIGGYEMNPELLKTVPSDFSFGLYNLDYNIFGIHIENACRLSPILNTVGIKSDINGPEAFTPDHKPLLGEDPRLPGMFHASGFNSAGIMLGPGCGEQLAKWIKNGRPDLAMHAYDIQRFSPNLCSGKRYITEATHEAYATNYSIVFPNHQPLAARNLKVSQFHEILVENGAVMEQSQEWERPAYFLKGRAAPVSQYDWYGCYGHNENTDKRYPEEIKKEYTFELSSNHSLIREEALSARKDAALFDLSHFGKMLLTGQDAERAAKWLFTSEILGPNSFTYSCTLNDQGGLEGFLRIVTLDERGAKLLGCGLEGKGYYIITEGTTGHRVFCHLQRQMQRQGFKASLKNVTDKVGVLLLEGPKSLKILEQVADFPVNYERNATVTINGHACRVMPVSSIGMKGYELYIPAESCTAVYNKITDAGVKLAGYRAYCSLNAEKGGYIWNYDIRTQDGPVEANLGDICNSEENYIGCEAVRHAKKIGTTRKRAVFHVDAETPLWGLEVIWRNNEIVGFLRRGNLGYFLNASIGIGYVNSSNVIDEEYLTKGKYEIESMGERHSAKLYVKAPLYC
ncbi:hypothetical protein PPYR_07451 [Photinus pyralis]|uniref:Sarcosine dehydrogenase n=1 Tax=Photinus pyralis TaxID=7054 RepID=A0A5N4AQI3_PHOPY|nr:sarcosine dehydrogenase, mitochondrial-like isoform X2 [Photinus pyralis]KAB0799571.1 hypothetical protein PPYR_07451 [Photinus pyralis]